MDSLWGLHPPKFVLKHNYTDVHSIVMPEPVIILPQYKPEPEIIQNYKGDTIDEDKQFRFACALRFENLTVQESRNIGLILGWPAVYTNDGPDVIVFYPDNTVNYYSEVVTIEEYEWLHIENKAFYDGIEMTLRGVMRRSNYIAGYDSLNIASSNKYIAEV